MPKTRNEADEHKAFRDSYAGNARMFAARLLSELRSGRDIARATGLDPAVTEAHIAAIAAQTGISSKVADAIIDAAIDAGLVLPTMINDTRDAAKPGLLPCLRIAA